MELSDDTNARLDGRLAAAGPGRLTSRVGARSRARAPTFAPSASISRSPPYRIRRLRFGEGRMLIAAIVTLVGGAGPDQDGSMRVAQRESRRRRLASSRRRLVLFHCDCSVIFAPRRANKCTASVPGLKRRRPMDGWARCRAHRANGLPLGAPPQAAPRRNNSAHDNTRGSRQPPPRQRPQRALPTL